MVTFDDQWWGVLVGIRSAYFALLGNYGVDG